MIIYVLAGAIAIAILWVAYRSLGRAATHSSDNVAILRQVIVSANAAARSLSGLQGAQARPADQRSTRRSLDGCAQLLESVDTAALDPDQEAAHVLLVASVEQLAWAARIGESAGFGANAGLQQSVRQLLENAVEGLVEAGALVRSAIAEEADSPA